MAPPGLAAAYDALLSAGVICCSREGTLRLSPQLVNHQAELARLSKLLVYQVHVAN